MNYCYIVHVVFSCAFQVLSLYSAERFIKAYDPHYSLASRCCYVLLIPVFSVLAVLSMPKDMKIINMLFSSGLYGFLSLFIILDVERNWLPKSFTLIFIITGFFYRTIDLDSEWWSVTAMSCLLFMGLYLFRACINRRAGGEVFGLGDIYLIVGLSVWFSVITSLKITIIATIIAIVFILLKKYSFPSRWYRYHECRGAPFSPFLCGVAAVWGILPDAIFS